MEFPLEKINNLPTLTAALQQPSTRLRFNTISDHSHSSCETSESVVKGINTLHVKQNFDMKFYRNGNELRTTYYNKLRQLKYISSFENNVINRDYNSILIFDWDDTLLCSSYLIRHNYFINETNKTKLQKYKDKLVKLENYVYTLLTTAIQYGDTYIITNASHGWVEVSAQKYYPKIVSLFSSIRIISARHIYEKDFPNNGALWKRCTFMNVANLYNKHKVTNIIVVGDSECEIDAANQMGTLFDEAFVKTIKCQEEPKPESIVMQLNLMIQQLNDIHSSTRNMAKRIEKKKRNSKYKEKYK
jgi:hypothetical protein